MTGKQATMADGGYVRIDLGPSWLGALVVLLLLVFTALVSALVVWRRRSTVDLPEDPRIWHVRWIPRLPAESGSRLG